MESVVAYLLKSVVISGALIAYYWVFLRNKKFNHYNRFYLLFSLFVAVVIPLLKLRVTGFKPPANYLPEKLFKLVDPGENIADPPQLQVDHLLPVAAVFISAALMLLLLLQVLKIYRLKSRYSSNKIHGIDVFVTDLDEAPFSFAKNLFWKENIDMQGREGQAILRHEMAHIREGHTYDKLLCELVVRIFWINPFFWIIRKELGLVHEFIADRAAVPDADTQMFAAMLLGPQISQNYPGVVNAFFYSPIKRRLIMLTTSGNPSLSYFRRICVFPVVLTLFFVLSARISNAQTDSSGKADSSRKEKLEDERMANPFNQIEPKGYSPNEKEVRALFEKIVANPPADRIYFIDGKKASAEKLRHLKFESTKEMQLLPPEDALKKFGVTGQKGVISINTKSR